MTDLVERVARDLASAVQKNWQMLDETHQSRFLKRAERVTNMVVEEVAKVAESSLFGPKVIDVLEIPDAIRAMKGKADG